MLRNTSFEDLKPTQTRMSVLLGFGQEAERADWYSQRLPAWIGRRSIHAQFSRTGRCVFEFPMNGLPTGVIEIRASDRLAVERQCDVAAVELADIFGTDIHDHLEPGYP